MTIIEQYESEVRSYCRRFPAVFTKAKGAVMTDENGHRYIDFFDGAGALNYGHNHPKINRALIDYIESDGIMHGLDLTTEAKKDFIDAFENKILKPRGLDYKLMFCGATGTNSVEAALKLARKVKKRQNILAFSGAFHGMSLGSLAATTEAKARHGAGVPLGNVSFMPFPFGFNESFDTIAYIENVLNDDHSGVDYPAAVIVETVQAEGGICVADIEWLKRLRDLCDRHDILLICDDIQVGCGRTGNFFSFERAGIVPDMVTLSKSISGSGLPMAMLLLKPEIDVFLPAEHNGTFRGNQLGFVGAKAAVDLVSDTDLLNEVKRKEALVNDYIDSKILPMDERVSHRGIGLIHGIDLSAFGIDGLADSVSKRCFEKGLIIELAGRKDSVIKLLPPLIIPDDELLQGLDIIAASLAEKLAEI
ncbi:MAG: diaminobutyrate--2-oxoglutarate transaminase [Eubacteriaceae bacterium]|nr:diaminobutyrate--2-oxoglutarate transaminase [Eubacteriaceae bacterium]